MNKLALLATVSLLCLPALAHDMWVVPPVGAATAGTPVEVEISVGVDFPTSIRAIDPERVTALAVGPRGARVPMRLRKEDDKLRTIATFTPSVSGAWLTSASTRHEVLRIEASDFNAYLLHDGMPHVLAARMDRDELGRDAVERYSKYVKTLIAAPNGQAGDTARVSVGLELEIVLLADPFTTPVGSALPAQVIFRGEPLEHANLCWDHPGNSEDFSGQTWTDAEGKALVPVSRAGLMTLRLVHMTRPLKTDYEWESFWSSFTLRVPETPSEIRQQEVPLAGYPTWLRDHVEQLRWQSHEPIEADRRLTREVLEQSLDLGRRFLVNNQRTQGNFNYLYDFVKREIDQSDSPVRQAGTLWSVALLNSHYARGQGEADSAAARETLEVLYRGLAFFLDHTRPGPAEDSLLIEYPGESKCRTGTVALVALAIIDFLRVEDGQATSSSEHRIERSKLEETLAGYLRHLLWMRLPNKHFSQDYDFEDRERDKRFSPYYDGETLLALVKAAKYLDRGDLIPTIEDSALTLAKHYTVDQWGDDPDSDRTKGFFQWSCMAFQEYEDAGWNNAEVFGDYVLALGWWMIHTHRTLRRQKNTGYAYEGIIQAYRIAKKRGDAEALLDLSWTIERGLSKLTSWQVGGPLNDENAFLRSHPTTDPLAVGGILNSKDEAPLRIDVTQHQMHAVVLALEHVFGEAGDTTR